MIFENQSQRAPRLDPNGGLLMTLLREGACPHGGLLLAEVGILWISPTNSISSSAAIVAQKKPDETEHKKPWAKFPLDGLK